MTLYFVKLKLRKQEYTSQVSTEGCSYVDDFRNAIKKTYSPLLDSYASAQLTLLQPDGTTEIDPGKTVALLDELTVGPWNCLVVTVQKLPVQASIGSSKKQILSKGMSTEASCRKYLDAIASQLSLSFLFDIQHQYPAMGDVLAAKGGRRGATWDYNPYGLVENKITEPLPSLFSQAEWNLMNSLNCETNERIHSALLPQTTNEYPFVIISRSNYESMGYVDLMKSIACIASVDNELVVKDELELSAQTHLRPLN